MLDRGRDRTGGGKRPAPSTTPLVSNSTIFRFSTSQCRENPERAQEAIEECCFACGSVWGTNSVTIRYWDTLDGPWLDDWGEASGDDFFVEVEIADD